MQSAIKDEPRARSPSLPPSAPTPVLFGPRSNNGLEAYLQVQRAYGIEPRVPIPVPKQVSPKVRSTMKKDNNSIRLEVEFVYRAHGVGFFVFIDQPSPTAPVIALEEVEGDENMRRVYDKGRSAWLSTSVPYPGYDAGSAFMLFGLTSTAGTKRCSL